jgi:hypothetical protein
MKVSSQAKGVGARWSNGRLHHLSALVAQAHNIGKIHTFGAIT